MTLPSVKKKIKDRRRKEKEILDQLDKAPRRKKTVAKKKAAAKKRVRKA